jgi:hypothetical protein
MDISCWEDLRGVIRSRKGGWKMGQGVFSHGINLLEDMVGELSYFQVMFLHATGRMKERRFADWVEALHICMSWPDPRIWCNQIGALGGSMRCSPVAATAAGIMAGDSRIYGQGSIADGIKFIQRALNEHKSGMPVEDIVVKECARHGGKPQIMGFARPIAKGDERVTAMERVSKELGFVPGDHLSLAYEIEKILAEKFNESMNINGYSCAFLSDQELSPDEVYRFGAILISSGVTACYVDTFERPPETFLPMRCDDVDYQGKSPRSVPDK